MIPISWFLLRPLAAEGIPEADDEGSTVDDENVEERGDEDGTEEVREEVREEVVVGVAEVDVSVGDAEEVDAGDVSPP